MLNEAHLKRFSLVFGDAEIEKSYQSERMEKYLSNIKWFTLLHPIITLTEVVIIIIQDAFGD